MPVVVTDDRISLVAPNEEAPQGEERCQVYDIGGRTLMSGLIQSHCHIAYTNIVEMSDVDILHSAPCWAIIAAKNAELMLKSGYTGAIDASAMHSTVVALK